MAELPRNFVIQFWSELSRNGKFDLLIDTGATCSLIDVDSLRPDIMIYSGGASIIKGLFPETRKALGICHGSVRLDSVEHACTFQVVKNMSGIPGNGILGQDFLMKRAAIDCISGELRLHSLEEGTEGREDLADGKVSEGTSDSGKFLNTGEFLKGTGKEDLAGGNVSEGTADSGKSGNSDSGNLFNSNSGFSLSSEKILDSGNFLNSSEMNPEVQNMKSTLIKCVKTDSEIKGNRSDGGVTGFFSKLTINGPMGEVVKEGTALNKGNAGQLGPDIYGNRDWNVNFQIENRSITVEGCELESNVANQVVNWEKYSNGVGSRLLRGMGYRNGQGLGKNLQGITCPIEAIGNIGRRGIGSGNVIRYDLDGSDFDGMNEIFVFSQFPEIEIPRKKVEVNEPERLGREVIIPARTEAVVRFQTGDKFDIVCVSGEVAEGVFMGNTITRPKGGVAMVSVINSNPHSVTLTDFQPTVRPLHEYRTVNSILTERDKMYKGKRHRLLLENLSLRQDLNEEERSTLKQICIEYNDVFHLPGDKLTHTNVRRFKLPMREGAKIVHRRQYRLPEAHKAEVRKQVDKLLEQGIIEPSHSPYNSPIILVPKKGMDEDGKQKKRLCVDFRALNEECVPFSYPLPRIEDILDKLGHARYFTTMDLSQGFHQVEIEPTDREKTAFSTDFGKYQYKKCPFGLRTIPGFFQNLLNTVLCGLQGVKCFVYLDDVVIFAGNLSEHHEKLLSVLQRFREANLKLNPEKCRFLEKEVVYLGHKCSIQGVSPNDELVSVVANYPAPKNVRQVQVFLGLANYYRKFIKNFARISRPIVDLLKKDTKFDWTIECMEAIQTLKKALINPPVLRYPDFSLQFDLITDASGECMGAVLEQEGRPISYASRSLNAAEKGYSTTERECLSVVWATRNFRSYLLGRHFRIFTDHMPLSGQVRIKDPTARMLKFALKLAEYDFEMIYKPGKQNGNADCLSRLPSDGNAETGTAELCMVMTRRMLQAIEDTTRSENLRAEIKMKTNEEENGCMQENAPDCTLDEVAPDEVKGSEKNQGSKGDNDADIAAMTRDNDTVVNDNENEAEWEGIYDSRDEDAVEEVKEADRIGQILSAYHDSVFGGHFGMAKTYDRIRRKFHWKGMKRDIFAYVKKCQRCQKSKVGKVPRAPLQIVDVASKPFDKIYIDIVGPLTPSNPSGCKYILSMVDDLTRFVAFAAIPNQTAETVAKALFEEILCRFSLPKQIISDNGGNFVAKVLDKICKLMSIKHDFTTPYHPQSNAVERQHSTLGNYLRTFVDGHPANWEIFLKTAAFAYNNTPHASTGYAPMQLLYGFVAEIPGVVKGRVEPRYNYDDYYYELRYKMQESFKLARSNLKRAKEVAKKGYDKRAKVKEKFHIGDKCLIRSENRDGKLADHWVGPYEVVLINGPVNVTLLVKGILKKIHVNRLKLYCE